MNSDMLQQLWNAGQEEIQYPQEVWSEIIKALIEDFLKYIGRNLHHHSDIHINNEEPHSPSFNVWLWGEESEKTLVSATWIAVMGGQMVATEKRGKSIFYTSLTLFMFDTNSKKRLSLTTGESIREFVFEKPADGSGCWRNLGWFKDVYGEWEEIESYD